jgi:A/G-specific adenine glycosylase
MLQQTRVSAVIPYFERFMDALPCIRDLAEVPDERLMKLWEGLGYYSRARNLKKAAQAVCEEHGGIFPSRHEDILRLPGIGSYTAGAIASICFGLPTPAVDGNVLRVFSRLYEIGAGSVLSDGGRGAAGSVPMDGGKGTAGSVPLGGGKGAAGSDAAVKRWIQNMLSITYIDTPPASRPDLTQALMELGALVCLPGAAANCPACPLSGMCLALRNGTVAELPVKAGKKPRREERRTVLLLCSDGKYAIRQRPEKGLLAELWEFPNLTGWLEEAEVLRMVADWGLQPLCARAAEGCRHVFTHIVWDMRCYYVACTEREDSFVWADAGELSETYALPTAFRAVWGCSGR